MSTGERMGLMTVLPSITPVDSATAPVAGTYISLKMHQWCTVLIALGVVAAGTVTIQLQQATNVAAAGVKNLLFTHVWRMGCKVFHDAPVGTFQVGEIVTGVGSGTTGLIHEVHGSFLIVYEIAVATFVVGDVLTGTTSAATANATTIALEYGLNCRVPMAAAATLIALTIPDETYEIEVDPASLDINNGFDCLVAQVSASGGANIVGISYLLKPRYKEQPQKSAYQN